MPWLIGRDLNIIANSAEKAGGGSIDYPAVSELFDFTQLAGYRLGMRVVSSHGAMTIQGVLEFGRDWIDASSITSFFLLCPCSKLPILLEIFLTIALFLLPVTKIIDLLNL